MPSTETPVTPIVGPLLALLRSRKVLVALRLRRRALGTYTQTPAPILDDITNLGLAIIATIAAEDVARYFFNRPTSPRVVNHNTPFADTAYLADDDDRDPWWFVDTPDGGVWVNGRTGKTAAGEFFGDGDEDNDTPEDKTGG